MAALYPSNEWCEEWRKAINNSEECAAKGKNWGVDFNGNFVFELIPSGGLDKTTYLYMETKGGKCTAARLIDGPSTVDAGFCASGSYEEYKNVVKGKKDFIESMVRGLFKLKGDMSKIMRNAQFIRAVANSISSFEAKYLGE